MWSAVSGRAETVTVTSGNAVVLDGGGGTFLTFDVTGNDFTALGSWDNGAIDFLSLCSGGCTPGTNIPLSSRVMNDSLLPSTVGELGAGAIITYQGVALNGGRVVELLGNIQFTTRGVTLPTVSPDQSGATLTAPFTMTGTVSGYNPFDYYNLTKLFTTDVTGAGTATMRLPFNPVTGTYSQFGALRYDFEAAMAPTPEPATTLLLGAGLLTLAAIALRRGERRWFGI